MGLGKYEETVFESGNPILSKVLLWKRFIDDVLMLFRGSKQECESLVEWLNGIMPGTVKFKFEFSYKEIEYLDLKIFLQDGKLRTNLYVKPTNRQLYLDFTSNHPDHCKEGIPYSQALRIIERCSTPEDTEFNLAQLETKLIERNYPTELVTMQVDRAKKKDRRDLIFQSRKNKNSKSDKVRLMLTHNEGNPPFHKWIRESKKLLSRNDDAKTLGDCIQNFSED